MSGKRRGESESVFSSRRCREGEKERDNGCCNDRRYDGAGQTEGRDGVEEGTEGGEVRGCVEGGGGGDLG